MHEVLTHGVCLGFSCTVSVFVNHTVIIYIGIKHKKIEKCPPKSHKTQLHDSVVLSNECLSHNTAVASLFDALIYIIYISAQSVRDLL